MTVNLLQAIARGELGNLVSCLEPNSPAGPEVTIHMIQASGQ